MSKRPKDSKVGPWAKEKLDSLRRYLEYYTTRLKNQSWCEGTFFIDAFAGPGISEIRKRSTTAKKPDSGDLFGTIIEEDPEAAEREYIHGSPRVALAIKNRFSDYIFIERDPKRLAELHTLRAEFANGPRIEVFDGDAAEQLNKFLRRGNNWRKNRGVVFLDPFGMQVPWTTISTLAKTKGLEVFLNFPFQMAINRLLKVSGDIPPAWEKRLDDTFGSPDWRSLVYNNVPDMMGSRKVKRDDATERVLNWFSGRLRREFGYASEAQLIRNTRGNALYYLIWAGPHSAGLTGADYILGKKRSQKKTA